MDLFEGNVQAARATLHTRAGTGLTGYCNQWGCAHAVGAGPGGDFIKYGVGHSFAIDTSQPFDVRASFDDNGHMEVVMSQGGAGEVKLWDVWNAGNGQDRVPEEESALVREALERGGLTLVASLWGTDTADGMSWLDGGCQVACNVDEAVAVFSNLRVSE